jgi:two-component system NtrC family sensor kinase
MPYAGGRKGGRPVVGGEKRKTALVTGREHQLEVILDALGDGVYIVNQDFTLVYLNPAIIALLGDQTGEKCYRAVSGREDVCPWCRAREVFAGKTLCWEHRSERLNRSFTVTEVPLGDKDGSVLKLAIFRDITHRRQREERLRATEEDYRRLFEHVACGVYISSREGKFIDANRALLEMLGYESKEEFLDIDIAKDLYVRPEDRRRFQERIETEGKVVDYEVEFKRRDGRSIPVFHTGHVRRDPEGNILGYEGINVDQSQRKRMERELKEAHDFLSKIIQSSPDAIMAADMRGNIILWNRAAEETLGYKADEVIGKMNIEKIYPEGAARQVMKMLRSPEYGGAGRLRSYPIVYVTRNGRVMDGSLSAAIVYDAGGAEIASVGIFVDLKERLEMESKLREVQQQLLQSEKLAAMGRLTSQIAHELNNPLYGIMNTLELLKTEVPPESKRRRILEMALSEAMRLTELLRKMLSFSKPDEEERQPTDINTVLDEILLLYGKQLRENSIRISASYGEGLGKVYASKNQLRQVFLNMISNARDAMPEGGTLTVATLTCGSNIHIRIADNGIGIKEEHLHRIFEAFFTTKTDVKGVGLGLSVCYGFIKDHGGDIQVESTPGAGTTFTIVLPVMKEG